MWTWSFSKETDIEPEHIWPVLADIENWPSIDENIEFVTVYGTPSAGSQFTLKPKGGPKLSFTIGEFQPPHVYSDICRMPLARMETRHTVHQGLVTADIRIEGALSGLWGRLVGRKHARGLPALTEKMLKAARARLENG